MINPGKLTVSPHGDCEIVMRRTFHAPRQLVFEAFTKPELLKRWFCGPPGWSLVVCEVSLTPGASYRYVWRAPDGSEMGMGGTVLEVSPPERMVATERFDQPWYPGEAVGTMVLEEEGGQTGLTQTIVYQWREACDAVLRSPMEQGVAMGYDRLAELLALLPEEHRAQ